MTQKNIRVRAAGILREGNTILLIKHKKNGNEYWLLPGGGVDYGETFQNALEREFVEETNLKVKAKNMIFIMESIEPSGSKHIVNVTFFVEKISGEIKIGDEERLGELRFVDIEDLDDYIIFPNIKKELKEVLKSGSGQIKYIENRWENG